MLLFRYEVAEVWLFSYFLMILDQKEKNEIGW